MEKVTQKALAVKCLEMLNIHKPYIKKFKSKDNMPCFFEHYAGFWADQEPEVYNKVREVEEERGYIVYAITHEITDLGESWSMLCVPKDTESIEELLDPINKDTFYALAYVWNKSNPKLSELGDIAVRSALGGIKRVG